MEVVRPPSGGRGGRLSNTWLTYPRDGDSPGKLGLIPDRWGGLERVPHRKGRAAMQARPPEDGAAAHHGSWRGNGPPSR